MSTAPKLAQRLANPGSFHVEQQQRLAQDTARKVNTQADVLNALINRSYAALATDFTQASTATYATLLTANITTVLARGYLVITFSASGQQITNASVDVFQVAVDGAAVKGCYTSTPLNGVFAVGMVVRVPVARGAHVVTLQTKVNSNSLTIHAASVNEEHAHMLVQEAS